MKTIITLVSLSSILVCLPASAQTPSSTANEAQRSPFETAVWIGTPKGAETAPSRNIHYAFRHKVILEDKPAAAPVGVTADARYIMWVNGAYVGRGPARCYPWRQTYDEFDLAPFLREGTNWIAAQVHEFGQDNGQHIYSGKHGLILEGEIRLASGKVLPLRTDENWEVRRADWQLPLQAFFSHGQTGFQEGYDARLEPTGWREGAGEGGWRKAVKVGAPGEAPWKTLEPRGLKPMKETLVKPEGIAWAAKGWNPPDTMSAGNLWTVWNESKFETLAETPKPDCEGWVTVSPGASGFVALAFDYGWNHAAYARILVRGAQGGEVFDNGCAMRLTGKDRRPSIFGSDTKGQVTESHPEPRGQFDRFIAREGECAWQSYILRSFRYQVVVVRADWPVTFRVEAIRAHHDAGPVLAFACSDPAFNQVWEATDRTLRAGVLDAFVDNNWREQQQWIHDGCVSALGAWATYGDTSLWKRGLLREVLPDLRRVMLQAIEAGMTSEALFLHPPKRPVFLDWVQRPWDTNPYNLTLNLVVLRAFRAAARVAAIAGDEELAEHCRRRDREMTAAVEARFWSDEHKGWRENVEPSEEVRADDRARNWLRDPWQKITVGMIENRKGNLNLTPCTRHGNALPLLLKLGTAEQQAAAAELVVRAFEPNNPNNNGMSPLWTDKVFGALFEAGRDQDAIRLLQESYGTWVTKQGAMHWAEGFGASRDSPAHSCGSSVNWLLSSYVLGVRPTKPGFGEAVFDPRPGKLTWAKGVSLVYTKSDASGVPQVWTALLKDGGKPKITQLTKGRTRSFSPFASLNPADGNWLVGYGAQPFRLEWLDPTRPEVRHQIPDMSIESSAVRFIEGRKRFVYPRMIRREPLTTEIAVVDTVTGEIRTVTEDGGDKPDVWAVRVPEFNGELVWAANPNHEEIAIYRDAPDGKGFARKVASLTLPADSPHRYIYSFEPIQGLTNSTTTYFVMVATEQNKKPLKGGGDCALWILGLGTDPKHRLARRVDEGAITGRKAIRFEPETWIGQSEVFFYYNPGGALRRCRTGIGIHGELLGSAAAPSPAAQVSGFSGASSVPLFRRAFIDGLTDASTAVNGFALADLNRDGLPDLIATRQVRTGFFARPGRELPQDRLDVLINRGGMKFEPHTITISGSDLTPEKFGVSAEIPNLVDFNDDGFLDIFVTRSGGMRYQKRGNTLLLSDGAWDTFRDVSAAMGVQNLDGYNRQSSIGDVNGDGWLDIAIGCDTIGRPDRFGTPHSRLFVFQPKGAKFEDGQFADIAGTLGLKAFGGYTGDPAKDKAGPGISLRDLDNDGDLDLVQTYHADMTGAMQNDREAAANYDQGVWVWKNLLWETGELRFARVTDNGLAEYASLRWNAETERYDATAIGSGLPYLAWADVDNDGRLDALAAGPNSPFWAPRADYTGGRFWRNLGGFRFQQDTAGAGFASLDWTYNQIYEHNAWEISPRLRDTSPRTVRVPPGAAPDHGNKQPGIPLYGPGGNHPYFADVIFGDFDNDGWQDVVLLDRSERPGQNTYALFYLNERGYFRLLKTADTGLDAGGISGEAADLNGDGWLDLVFAADPMNSAGGRRPEPERFQSKVFLNTGAAGGQPHHWLHLAFTGLKDAELIGARVELTADGKKQYRWIHSNHSYKSGGALDAHFGLGSQDSANVAITLLNGKNFNFANVTAGHFLDLNLNTQKLAIVEASK